MYIFIRYISFRHVHRSIARTFACWICTKSTKSSLTSKYWKFCSITSITCVHTTKTWRNCQVFCLNAWRLNINSNFYRTWLCCHCHCGDPRGFHCFQFESAKYVCNMGDWLVSFQKDLRLLKFSPPTFEYKIHYVEVDLYYFKYL